MGRWTMSVLLLGALTTGCNQSSVGDPAPSRGFPEVTATLTFEGVTYGGNMNITTDLGEERLSFTGYAMEGSDVIGGASLTIQQTLTRGAWNESSYDLYDLREDWFITEDGFQPGTMQLGEHTFTIRGLVLTVLQDGSFVATVHAANVDDVSSRADIRERELVSLEVSGTMTLWCAVHRENGMVDFVAPPPGSLHCQ